MKFPAAIVAEKMLVTAVSKQIDAIISPVSFLVDFRIEDSPSDLPPAYFGATRRVEYWLEFYDWNTFGAEYRIGQKIHDVYYIMP